MKQAYRRWVCGLLTVLIALLAVCGAIVYVVDPCLYYRLPDKWQPVFFNERYQMAGLAKNVEADTVLVGTSMAANYRASWIEGTFGTSAVRLTIPDGYYSEFDQLMNVLFRAQDPERVIFGMDVSILIRDESGLTGAMPEYLYNSTPLDDIQYLLNKDTLYYSAYTLLSNHWGEGDAEHVAANVQVVEGWLQAHPETEFDLFLPPYSILFWDRVIREGRADAVFAAIRQAVERLLPYENVKIYGYLMDEEIVTNLDNYCDNIHHSGDVCRQVLAMLRADEGRLTEENLEETLANWHEFVIHYDYDKFWDQDYWIQWNTEHSADQ